ncbi:unnamed protein product [Durusdinium trenchii]|uniref:DinB-like domain-containing protein n=1 Tax=Durusdinium trenchii TaxID=1381693 RepID=A0ABP0MW32_9DINO
MNGEPCAKLKAFVEHSLQGLAQSTRALRQAPSLDSTWASELFGEMLVHHLGVWEHHLGAEMMCRADQIPSHAIEPREAARPPRQVSRIVQAEEVRDDEWLLCRSRSGSPTSESDWTVVAPEEIEMS